MEKSRKSEKVIMMRKIKKVPELLHDRRRVNLQNDWVGSKVYSTTPLAPDLPS